MHEFVCSIEWMMLNLGAWISKQCPPASSFFILFLLKNNNQHGGITTLWAAAAFYSGHRCTAPPLTRFPISVGFMRTVTCDAMQVDRISNGVICKEDIMQYCVRPVYTTYANTNKTLLTFCFSPGAVVVSEMKQTANISCLLHCAYYTISAGAEAWAAVGGSTQS